MDALEGRPSAAVEVAEDEVVVAGLEIRVREPLVDEGEELAVRDFERAARLVERGERCRA